MHSQQIPSVVDSPSASFAVSTHLLRTQLHLPKCVGLALTSAKFDIVRPKSPTLMTAHCIARIVRLACCAGTGRWHLAGEIVPRGCCCQRNPCSIRFFAVSTCMPSGVLELTQYLLEKEKRLQCLKGFQHLLSVMVDYSPKSTSCSCMPHQHHAAAENQKVRYQLFTVLKEEKQSGRRIV